MRRAKIPTPLVSVRALPRRNILGTAKLRPAERSSRAIVEQGNIQASPRFQASPRLIPQRQGETPQELTQQAREMAGVPIAGRQMSSEWPPYRSPSSFVL